MDIFTESFSLQTLTILLAEDDSEDILVFKEVISDFQITINLRVAKDGVEAIELLSSLQEVDIVFLDINMPLMNGFECLSEIRKQSWAVSVIMLSTSNTEQHVAMAKALGANGYITKPSSLSQYRQTIKNVITTDWTKQQADFYLDVP
ncbi:response regulator [Dyadobacter subterraneus]|uniref:Response regulator n=1 Tax=Dyadobacter subterraneus TaxID=2773304 RepID=A0ABR9WEI2_9BACT|nr:response regulator [Dyadobacter subterraneus]MBE9463895.1 response regulator [Dyadobacter subterraneus]